MYAVDADGHVMEPADLWTRRMDARRWGEWIPRYVARDSDGRESWYVGGVRRISGSAIFGCAAGYDPEELVARNWRYTEGHAAAWDPLERVSVLDAEGIAATVLYPSIALMFGPLDPIPAIRDVGFALACQQAYNDWIAEYCAAAPERLFAMAAVPLQDVKLAAQEAERAVVRVGHKGVFIRSAAAVDDLPFNHPVYDPFWDLCQQLDVPVALHPATHVDFPNAARKFGLITASEDIAVVNKQPSALRGGTAMSIAVGAPVDAIVCLARLLMGGVCERFPRLRFLVLESGGGWVASLLRRMDEELKANPRERAWLSLLPSEYFRRQCYVSFEPDDPTLPRLAELIGPERILWASDFPHADATYPGAVQALERNLARLAPELRRCIAGENAVAAYGLPRPPGAQEEQRHA
jgi:predicted TIM-barrel fold metal-dependent hydrolase